MTRISVFNAAWQLGGDPELIRDVVEETRCDIVAGVECRTKGNQPIPVAKILGPKWDTQQKLIDGPRAGSVAGAVTAVRKASGIDVRRSRLELLSHAGRDVQARYQRLTVVETPRGHVLEIPVWHAPLQKTGRHQEAVRNAAEMVQRVRNRRQVNPSRRLGIGLGDVNDDIATWAREIGWNRCYGVKPMGIFLSTRWGQVEFTKVRIKGSDHWILTVEADR